MTGKLLTQLAWVARKDSDEIYERPLKHLRTPEEWSEEARLSVVAARLSYRATLAGQTDQSLDALFT